MIKANLPKREDDDYGSGEYGASRGGRLHRGVDYACVAGSEIYSPVEGKVTKLGYPYSDDLSYRYVEVTDAIGFSHRLFYCLPSVGVGDIVNRHIVLGVAQDISARYIDNGHMNNHIHYEVVNYLGNGKEYFDPENYGG